MPPRSGFSVSEIAAQTAPISSAWTFSAKVVFPAFWILGLGAVTIAMWTSAPNAKSGAIPPDIVKWIFLMGWVATSSFFLWGSAQLKRARVHGASLYISNYLQEIIIPGGLIKTITLNQWIKGPLVTIHLGIATKFGESVTFIPKVQSGWPSWEDHPVVAELERLTRRSAQTEG
jgi:hypothetical protein